MIVCSSVSLLPRVLPAMSFSSSLVLRCFSLSSSGASSLSLDRVPRRQRSNALRSLIRLTSLGHRQSLPIQRATWCLRSSHSHPYLFHSRMSRRHSSSSSSIINISINFSINFSISISINTSTNSRCTTLISSRSSRLPLQTSGLCSQMSKEEIPTAHTAMCRRHHSVRQCHIGIHRRVRRAPRLRWTPWLVSPGQRKQIANVPRLIPRRYFQT